MRGLAAEEEHPRARPSLRRDAGGFVMGRGATLVLEELEAARARGANLRRGAQVWTSNDGYHMAAPDPESVGSLR
jgi:3-oxoacyl-(acyl-carrier-protein) synthase